MIPRRVPRFRRLLAVTVMTTAAVLASAIPAAAHQGVILDSSDVVPWQAPLSADGTDPVAFYGVLPHAGAIRSAQFQMQGGEPLKVGLVIPDKAPENEVPTWKLPTLLLIAPDLKVTVLNPTDRIPLDSHGVRNLLILRSYAGAAIAGTYSLVVSAAWPTRFAVSIGSEGQAQATILRGAIAAEEQVNEWYNTAPY